MTKVVGRGPKAGRLTAALLLLMLLLSTVPAGASTQVNGVATRVLRVGNQGECSSDGGDAWGEVRTYSPGGHYAIRSGITSPVLSPYQTHSMGSSYASDPSDSEPRFATDGLALCGTFTESNPTYCQTGSGVLSENGIGSLSRSSGGASEVFWLQDVVITAVGFELLTLEGKAFPAASPDVELTFRGTAVSIGEALGYAPSLCSQYTGNRILHMEYSIS